MRELLLTVNIACYIASIRETHKKKNPDKSMMFNWFFSVQHLVALKKVFNISCGFWKPFISFRVRNGCFSFRNRLAGPPFKARLCPRAELSCIVREKSRWRNIYSIWLRIYIKYAWGGAYTVVLLFIRKAPNINVKIYLLRHGINPFIFTLFSWRSQNTYLRWNSEYFKTA